MITTTQPGVEQASKGSPDKTIVSIGSAVGTTIENYDFTAFGVAAALYFGPAFFPAADPVTGVLLSFATLGVGFAVRPLGGLVGGHLGDKIGRKPVLLGSLIVMGAATFMIGLLPTYATVGFLAPLLLTLVRIIQGLAFGAEWGGAIMMTYEHAPWKRRGFFTSIPQAGIPMGLLLATTVFLGTAGWDNEWAWRVPFLASGVLVVAGIIIRMKVSESPDFENLKARGQLVKNPLTTVVRQQWRDILRVIGMRIAQAGGFYVVVSYFTSYITTQNLAERTTGLIGIVIAAGLGVISTLLLGLLSDKIGRKPLYIFGTLGLVLFAFPAFLFLNSGIPFLIVLAYVLGLSIFHDSMNAAQGGWFSELFPVDTRTSGASIGYQFSAAIAGFIPFIAVAAAETWGWGGVATLYAAIGAIGLVSAASTAETWTKARRTEVDSYITLAPAAARLLIPATEQVP